MEEAIKREEGWRQAQEAEQEMEMKQKIHHDPGPVDEVNAQAA